jgi:hypothetical protein
MAVEQGTLAEVGLQFHGAILAIRPDGASYSRSA